ncbi:MAG: UDP-glucose/GDP-mannose dehydrogenase family protein [candidate division WOR-3 bacterium]
MKPVNIGVIGAGYVGLTTAACFAHLGHKVICVDNDEAKIRMLLAGEIPFYEPGLDKLVSENTQEGRLQFSTQTQKAVKESLVLFIAVGTPPKETGEPDLSYVENVAQEIGNALDSYRVIVEKSTVPVKTGDWIKETITRYNKLKAPFDVASNPEFLREGSAINDFLHPDRIVIGVESEKAKEILLQVYEPIDAPKIITDIKSAELIKHASNAFLAMKISFINSISIICELAGASVDKVALGMGLDKRIGPAFLNAGVGYGGFCFPKDLRAFIKIAEELGYDYRLLKEVERINEEQKQRFVKKISGLLWNLRDKQLGILGLAFKPNTDDMRFAPSVDIINALQAQGAKIKAYDPFAMKNAQKVLKDVIYCNDPYEVAKDSEALIIITEWDEFRNLDLGRIKELLRLPIIIDGRNIFDPQKMTELGFIYRSIGR